MEIKIKNKLNELINNYNLNIENINDLSNIINEELDNINKIIYNYKKNESKINNIIIVIVIVFNNKLFANI